MVTTRTVHRRGHQRWNPDALGVVHLKDGVRGQRGVISDLNDAAATGVADRRQRSCDTALVWDTVEQISPPEVIVLVYFGCNLATCQDFIAF